MLQNRLIPLARLPFLSKGFATTLPWAVQQPSACTCSACCSGHGASISGRPDGRSHLLSGGNGTTWSWLRHAHDQRQGPPSDSGMEAALSAHLAQDAQRLVTDPVTMLMAARGIPLGVVMQVPRDGAAHAEHQQQQQQAAAAAAEPATQPGTSSEGAQVLQKLLGIIAAAGDPAPSPSSPEGGSQPGGGMSQAGSSGSSADRGGEGSSSSDDDGEEEARDEFLDTGVGATLQKQQAESINALKEELQHLDEVFEVLAEVPWLDEAEPEQAEKKELLRRVLLPALEERGWQLREGLESIWQGERDPEAVAGGAAPRERLALASVLFHVQQLEAKYGTPARTNRSA